MSQAVPFIQSYLSAIEHLVDAIETIKIAQARAAGDSTLVTAYFASPSARTDITANDVIAANNAVTALVNVYESGSPPNKTKLFFVT